MREPPTYPAWLVRLNSFSAGKLGNARFSAMGWVFLFHDGQLRVSEPSGVNVIDLSLSDTERFVDLVAALDAGRYGHADFALRADEGF